MCLLGFALLSTRLINCLIALKSISGYHACRLKTIALKLTFGEENLCSPKGQEGCHFMLPNLHRLFPFGTHRQPRTRRRTWPLWRDSFLLCQLCFIKAPFSLLPFISYICKIYLSNDKSLFGAQRLGE